MPTILKETYPTAKKEHICEFCGYKIQPGQKYVRQTNVYDGVVYDLSHIKNVRKLPMN